MANPFHVIPAPTNMVVNVTLGHQYGQEVIRPACDKAHKFCAIAGTKTVTRALVLQMKELGYTINVIPTQPTQL